MSAFELTPWEKRNEYYQNVQLGKNIKKQTEVLSHQTKEMLKAKAELANQIISSQQRISEGIDNVVYGLERVEEGIYGLRAAFEFGISEVVWQIEQNREILENILEVLRAPLDTAAKELRKRAEDAYANGWFDDALEDFLESEKKNKYDFSIHISLGMIYLFQKKEREKALEYFDKAVKYAKPKSPYHASYALLYNALIYRDLNKIEESLKCMDEAVDLSSDFAEVFYQNALYSALLNKHGKAIPLLNKAILMDVNYCEKTHSEKAFDGIRAHVNKLFESLRDDEGTRAKAEYLRLKERQNRFVTVSKETEKVADLKIEDREITATFERIEQLIKRNSYRDYLEANMFLNALSKRQNEFLENINLSIKSIIDSYGRDLSTKKGNILATSNNNKFTITCTITVIGFLIGLIIGFKGCSGYMQDKAANMDKLTNTFSPFLSNLFALIIGPPLIFIFFTVGVPLLFYVIGMIDFEIYHFEIYHSRSRDKGNN